MSPAQFGGQPYSSQETRALSSIAKSPEINSNTDFVKKLQEHDYQLKFLADNQKKLERGVNEATQNPIQQLQQFVADIIVLLGGGQLAKGALDFGDLKYILPALGALFGFGDGPFPVNLIAAAQRFFLGYVVPTQAFTDVINNIIEGWMSVFGIDEEFVHNVQELITALGFLFDGVTGLLPNLVTLFGALGITKGSDLGPVGQKLAPIIALFDAFDLTQFGDAIEFITDAINPFIVQLTAAINFLNALIHIFGAGGDVVNSPLPQLTEPWRNLIRFLGDVNFAVANFNPIAAAQQFLGRLLIPIGGISEIQPDLQIDSGFENAQSIGEGSPAWAPEDDDQAWAWDLVGQTVSGSAKITADGTSHALLGTLIPTVEGQVFNGETWVLWENLTVEPGPAPIRLQLLTDTEAVIEIASIVSPGASGGWTKLAGSWTVTAGVSTVRTRLLLDETATAGQVWWDNTPIRRANVLKQSLIQDLEDILFSIADKFATLLDGLLGTGHTMADLVAAMRGLVSPVVDLLDGTAAGLIGIVTNSDGTATYSSALIGNGINSLIAGADGTAMTIATALQNLANPAGIANFVRDGWNTLLQGTGLANAAQLVQSIGGLIPGVLHQGDGTASATAASPIQFHLDGTATLVQQQVSNGVAALIDQADGTVQSVATAFQQQAAAAVSLVGNNLTSAATAGQQLMNTLFGGFGVGAGTAVPAATPVQVEQAVVAAQENIANAAVGLAALQALLNQAANGGGMQVSISFANYPDGDIPAAFSEIIGDLSVSGGYLVGNGAALYVDAVTDTDQQIITGIFTGVTGASRPGLRGRVHATNTSFVLAYFHPGAAAWLLGAFAAGDDEFFAAAPDTFTPGAAYSLVCGTGAAANRVFQILKNGTPLNFSGGIGTNYIDSANFSLMGPNYRGGGVQLIGGGGEKCSAWTFADNAPPAVTGCGFRATRTSATGGSWVTPDPATIGGLSVRKAPADWYDTVEKTTGHFEWDSDTNTVTVGETGWYQVTVALSALLPSGLVYLAAGLYHNGEWGNRTGLQAGYSGAAGPTIAATWSVYCEEGDTLTPAITFSGSATSPHSPDSSGQKNYFEVAFINNGTLS
ncbi:hypothetical protein [Mycobacterium canetti]|uniref:hypothetical protein n=1 Tax=Mycobacterium canetti TaxID=78331 RepID=UPI00034AAB41|nr:hypothetical protein [Mycobacterium canetti]